MSSAKLVVFIGADYHAMPCTAVVYALLKEYVGNIIPGVRTFVHYQYH